MPSRKRAGGRATVPTSGRRGCLPYD